MWTMDRVFMAFLFQRYFLKLIEEITGGWVFDDRELDMDRV